MEKYHPLSQRIAKLQSYITDIKSSYDITENDSDTIDNHFIAIAIELEKLTATK